MELLILKIAFFGAAMAVSILMGSLFQYIVFILLFYLLRSYAGGYHAKTRVSCFIQSLLTVLTALAVLKIVLNYEYAIIFCFVFAVIPAIAVWILSPVDTENNRLDSGEKTLFRRKARIILLAELAISIAAYKIGTMTVSCSALLAVIISGLLVLAEYKNPGGFYGKK